MAIYNLRVEPSRGRSAVYRYEYTLRIENFSWEKNKKYDDFLYAENINMPVFAKNNPKIFWESCEMYERNNSNTFRTIDFSLLNELTDEENIEIARNFAKEIFTDKFAYSLAVHSKPSNTEGIRNIHCHIMFSERKLDSIERKKELFFKRYNRKNPELGGCEKDGTWTSFSKLYFIRQTWEKIANEELKHKGLNISISSKSLKTQRIDSLAEENYLKAELLDRPPVHIDKKYLEYSPNDPEKEKAIEFYNYTRKLKEIKEKEFKIKIENFEEENQKAKERFLKNIFELEGMKYEPSSFNIPEQQINDFFNFENIFIKSLENNVLLKRKEKRLAQINSLTNKDIEERAYKILTKGEYSKKLKKLNELKEIYDKLADKNTFKFNLKMNELNDYFKQLSRNTYFQNKFFNMKNNIKKKYEVEKEKIFEDLKILRENNFKDFYLENTPQNYERSKRFFGDTIKYIEHLKNEKILIDKKVHEYKKYYIDVDVKREIYFKYDKEIIAKYDELKVWKNNFLSLKDEKERIELNKKILARELGFKNFDIENNIEELLNKELNSRKKEYKNLRKEQDSIHGKLSFSILQLKELKEIEEINILDKEQELYEEYQFKENDENTQNFDKYEYNVKLLIFQKKYEKAFKRPSELTKFIIPELSEEIRKEYINKVKEKLFFIQNDLADLQKVLSQNILSNEDIKIKILDKNTNGLYTKTKNKVDYYKEKINQSISVSENTIMLKQFEKILKDYEKEYKITLEDMILERQINQEENSNIFIKIREKREQLNLYIHMLKQLRSVADKKIRKIKKRPSKIGQSKHRHLKTVQSGRIVIDDNSSKRKESEWENSM